jgi:hypothetical protein
MPDIRSTPDRDRPHASRARRGDAALVAQYIHELSERHDMAAQGSTSDREHGGDGRPEEGG